MRQEAGAINDIDAHQRHLFYTEKTVFERAFQHPVNETLTESSWLQLVMNIDFLSTPNFF